MSVEVTKQESITVIFCVFSLQKDMIVSQMPSDFNPQEANWYKPFSTEQKEQ